MQENVCVERGDIYASWDLRIKGGSLGSVIMAMAAEDHAEGKQFLRFRFSPRLSLTALFLVSFQLFLLVIAIINSLVIPAIVFGGIFLILFGRILEDYGRAYLALKTVAKEQNML